MVSYIMLPIRSVLLVLCLAAGVPTRAQKDHRRTSEGPGDLIEKARNLSLQKDRAQATNILVSAMRREPANSTAFREMRSALEEISTVFFNDRAQQLYELALSLRKTDPKQAQARLQEASRIEPDNLQVLNELARLQMIAGNCDNAAESLAQIRKTNPFDEQTLLGSAQAAVCQNDWPLYTSLRSQADGRKGNYKKSWLSLEVERADREKAESRAAEAFQALKAADPEHPELGYWEWRFGKLSEQKNAAGARYLATCKNPSTALLRRYLSEPFLCRKTAEVENAQKTGVAP